jgi:serine/alanine adding enzyme
VDDVRLLAESDSLPPAPDVYFSSGYGLSTAIAERGRWALLSSPQGSWQIPLVIRELPSGRFDAVSPYGYAGAYAEPGLSPAESAALWSSSATTLRDAGVVSIFIRESPMVAQAPRPDGAQTAVADHPTFVVPLRSESAMWSGMAGRSRTAVRKAERLGLNASIRVATPEDLHASGIFRTLYESTMSRVSAVPYYNFSDDYYSALCQGLGADLLIVEVVNEDKEPAAAALLMAHRRILHYHLSGSSLYGAKSGATNLLLWRAAQYAHLNGFESFFLGGGLAAGDGLDRFKRGFGGRELSFRAYGLIIDAEGYEEEVTTAAIMANKPREEIRRMTYFPAYRGMARR